MRAGPASVCAASVVARVNAPVAARVAASLAASVLLAACAPRFGHDPHVQPGLDVGRITGRWSNLYLLRGPAGALLVDSGSPPDCDDLVAALAGEPKLRAVIVTHAHADHAGCARVLQRAGAAIVLGAGDVGTAARGENERLQPTGLLAAAIAPLFMFSFEPFTPDLAVDRETDLAAYGFPEVRVAPAPGHTPGELVVRVGGAAFVGDMVKGGQVLVHSPTEHLYQADRAADHASLGEVVAHAELRELYPGHGGRLDAGDVRDWLAHAGTRGRDGAFELQLDGRVVFPDGADPGGTGGLRTRFAYGRRIGYAAGTDLRAGYEGRGVFAMDEYPIGIAFRGGDALLEVLAGTGFGGVRGLGATHAVGEVSLELPMFAVRVLARAGLGWRIAGDRYAGDAGIADEVTALVGLRLGEDRRWGAYVAGHGPYLAATFEDLGGAKQLGVALGFDLISATSR